MKKTIRIFGIYEGEKYLQVCDILQNDINKLKLNNTNTFVKNNIGTLFKVFYITGTETKLLNLLERNRDIITIYQRHYVLTTNKIN